MRQGADQVEHSLQHMERDMIQLQRLWQSVRRARQALEQSHRALLDSGAILAKLKNVGSSDEHGLST